MRKTQIHIKNIKSNGWNNSASQKQITMAHSESGKLLLKHEQKSRTNRSCIRTLTQQEMYNTNWQKANSQLHADNA